MVSPKFINFYNYLEDSSMFHNITVTQEWSQYSFSFVFNSTTALSLTADADAGVVDMCQIQLEEGNIFTGYRPHIMDYSRLNDQLIPYQLYDGRQLYYKRYVGILPTTPSFTMFVGNGLTLTNGAIVLCLRANGYIGIESFNDALMIGSNNTGILCKGLWGACVIYPDSMKEKPYDIGVEFCYV